jgi:hypothetical protein
MRNVRVEFPIVLKPTQAFRSVGAFNIGALILKIVVNNVIWSLGVKMESTGSGKQSFLKGRFYNAITVLLAFIVTIDVCLAIAAHWRTSDSISKFLGVVLILNLLIAPLNVIIRSRRGEKATPDMLVRTAYIWLLLATILFNR